MQTHDLIEALARELGASAAARKKWRQRSRGVPYRWRVLIIDEAAKRGVSLTNDDFQREAEAA